MRLAPLNPTSNLDALAHEGMIFVIRVFLQGRLW